MGHIKSALELALERTSGISSDRESLNQKTLKEEGMKLLQYAQDHPDENVADKIAKFPKDQQKFVREGLAQVLLARVKLPSNELALPDTALLDRCFRALVPDIQQVSEVIRQFGEFAGSYINDRKQLYTALVEQYGPVLRQKEQQIAAQTGQRVRLAPEQDPEFQKYYKQNLERLDEQYGQGVQQAKAVLEEALRKA